MQNDEYVVSTLRVKAMNLDFITIKLLEKYYPLPEK